MPRSGLSATALALSIVSSPAAAQVVFLPSDPPRRPAIGTWLTTVVPARPDRASLSTASLPHASVPQRPSIVRSPAFEGIASYYWQGQMTASGERFDRRGLTAAHKTLAFGTRVRVIHVPSGRSVVVRINDRGPFTPGRVIDLSEAAAEAIGMVRTGLAPVRIEVVP
jgi:rare lipoprotein A